MRYGARVRAAHVYVRRTCTCVAPVVLFWCRTAGCHPDAGLLEVLRMFFFNPTYFIFALPALILAFYAQWRVQSAYKKWLRVRNARGLTGLDAAKMLLRANNLGHISIEGMPGSLTDNYDPRTQT